jgi:hypothetical protein
MAAGDLTKSYDALLFAQSTALVMYGELRKVPEGHSAPGEINRDSYFTSRTDNCYQMVASSW